VHTPTQLPGKRLEGRLRLPVWLGHALGRLVDPLVIPSFDRTGFRIHALRFAPEDLDVDLSGRRCLVTGANSGIGFEAARALAELGTRVVLLCRSRERGEHAVERIRSETGSRCEPRRTHLLPGTREYRSERRALWALCERLAAGRNAGAGPTEPPLGVSS
jgi:hypothetical protein